VAELDPARASDDDVDLLLLPVAVAFLAAEAGTGAQMAHTQVLGIQMRPGEMRIKSGVVAEGVLDLFQVHNGVIRNGITLLWEGRQHDGQLPDPANIATSRSTDITGPVSDTA
jgi:hypothetical protein